MIVNFITPTKISLMDMSSMGDSSKRGNEETIGQFDSGFKFSIALSLRNEINLEVRTYNESCLQERYNFGTTMVSCDDTGKEKELITITTFVKPSTVVTGFAKALGYNWELWMLLRELWSNMLDEGGYVSEDVHHTENGTVVSIEFDDDSEFAEIWNNKHLYINQDAPLFVISSRVEALKNDEGFLRIYKQNILVYEDRETPSRFAYNIKFGEIDERRILSNIYNVESEIISAIQYTTNRKYLKNVITPDYTTEKGEFLNRSNIYGTASDLMHDVAAEVYEEHGQVKSYEWLINSIEKRKDCKIGGKIIRSIADSVWTYSTDVKVDSVPQTISEPLTVEEGGVIYEPTFAAKIKEYYNFELDVEVKQATLIGSKVIADKHEKCLIIDELFDMECDFGAFMIEYIDLTEKGNTVKNLGEYIVKLLRK